MCHLKLSDLGSSFGMWQWTLLASWPKRIFFHLSFTLRCKGNVWKFLRAPVFYKHQALYPFRMVSNTSEACRIQYGAHCKCNKTQKLASETHQTNALVHSHFAVFYFIWKCSSFYVGENCEFGSTPCIHCLISINWVLVIGYMHAIMFIVVLAR